MRLHPASQKNPRQYSIACRRRLAVRCAVSRSGNYPRRGTTPTGTPTTYEVQGLSDHFATGEQEIWDDPWIEDGRLAALHLDPRRRAGQYFRQQKKITGAGLLPVSRGRADLV